VTAAPFRCSVASETSNEPLLGTASTIRDWLLVEHPGPWGGHALRDARLPDGLGRFLRRRERMLGIRVLLIRRPGRRLVGGRSSCFALHTGPERPWIERTHLLDVREVMDLDLDALGRGDSVGLTSHEAPLFCVCTHGRRDPCCAERGRPLALALSGTFPDETWESTHIGGDRFAGNMIAFPHGFYLGRVEPDHAAGIAAAYAGGRIDLQHLRGRSCRPMDVQAAEHYLRVARDLRGVDDVGVHEVVRSDTETDATFRTSVGAVRVRVSRGRGPLERLTCHSETGEHPPAYELVGIDEA
jgi:hypothetical protein